MPKLVVCRCDPAWPAMAVCDTCEAAQLHGVLLRRGLVADNPIVAAAYDALAASYLDQRDADDRERDHADNHMLEANEGAAQ